MPDTFAISTGGGAASIRIMATPGGASSSPEPERPLSPEVRARIDRPDVNEPLSFAISELCGALAKPDGNLVALLPDSLLVPLSTRATQPINAAELKRILTGELDMTVGEQDGWTVVMPKFPSLSRTTRVERVALSGLLSGIGKDGKMSLDRLSGYAARRAQPSAMGFETAFLGLLHPQALPAFRSALPNWTMLQFYAALDPGRRAYLRDDGGMPIAGLSNQQMALLSSMVYNDPQGPTRRAMPQGRPQGPGQGQQRQSVIMTQSVAVTAPMTPGSGFMDFSTSLMDERTEFLPAGVPTIGRLRFEGRTEDAVYATANETATSGRFFTAGEYGTFLGMASGPMAQYLPQYGAFRNGTVTHMTFTFELTPESSLVRLLDENAVDMASKGVSYGLVAERFRAAAEEARARMGARGSNMNVQVGGQRIPPPPRR